MFAVCRQTDPACCDTGVKVVPDGGAEVNPVALQPLPTIALGGKRVPMVSLGKVKTRSSNAAVAAARYHHRDLSEDYEVFSDKVLGEGCSGSVVVAKSRTTGRRFALKSVRKSSVPTKILQQLLEEAEIFLTLDHPNVAHLHDVYDTNHEIAFLTECLDGGELYDRLANYKTFPEALAAETTRQMLRAVGYLHSHNIVHRDLKLENFLYESKDLDSQLKVIDFGFAKVWDPSKPMQASCGSMAYVSPDVLAGQGYTSKCDLWSLGVIVFMLLAGYPPFHGDDDQMRSSITSGNVDWQHKRRWAKVSQTAIDFVQRLLVKDPVTRLDALGALNHQWLVSTAPAAHTPVLSTATLRAIGNYASAPSLRRAVLQLLARELSPSDVAGLRHTFLELADDEGTVNFSELKAAIRRVEPAQVDDADVKTPSRKLRRAKTERLRELFQSMDVNDDEQIYYSDFLAATTDESLLFREEHIRAAFHRLDADNSGSISAEDIQAVIGDTFEGVETCLLMRDVGLSPSGYGEIDFESFVQVLEAQSMRPPEVQEDAGSFDC